MISTLRQHAGLALKRYVERRAYMALTKNPALREILQHARKPGFKYYQPDITTNIDYSDSLALYRWIRKHKPKEILEFGPGVSTLIMAQALYENGRGRVTTIENIEKFLVKAKDSCPERLQPYIEYLLIPDVKKRYGPFHGVGYDHIPKRDYELVFVDGPNYDAQSEFDVDVLDVIARSEKPVSAFIDSRTGSSFMYHLILGKKFKYRYLTGLGFIDAATKRDLQPFKKIVATAMKRRAFRRWW